MVITVIQECNLMKTSDVLTIGYARIYGFGEFRSRFDATDPQRGGVINTSKMVLNGDIGSLKDFIEIHPHKPGYPELESELELIADNNRFFIRIQMTTPLNSTHVDELAVLKGVNDINRIGRSCATSYNAESRCIETKANICLIGYPIWQEEDGTEGTGDFSSSPEIESFVNLMCQVFDATCAVTEFVSKVVFPENPDCQP